MSFVNNGFFGILILHPPPYQGQEFGIEAVIYYLVGLNNYTRFVVTIH